MAYLLDTNVFIGVKNSHYGFDFCPAFWDWLILKHEAGIVFSVAKVREELLAGEDRLSDWARGRGSNFFRSPTEADLQSLATVRRWVEAQRYLPAAISAFLQKADYYLVAQALAGGHTVVTHEVPADTQHRVKIPNACEGVGVRCINTLQMLCMEQARFVLGSTP